MADLDLASLMKGNIPLNSYADLQPGAQDTAEASSLTDIANGITPVGASTAILKGLIQGKALTKKEQAAAQKEAWTQHLQELSDWEVNQKKHQAEMSDLLNARQYAMAKQGAFVDGLQAVIKGGDPQPLVDLMNGEPSMARTAAMQFGVDPKSRLVDIQSATNRNGETNLIGVFTDAQGQRFTAPTQVPFSKVASAIAQPLLDQRAAEAASHALETRKTMAGIEKDEASAAKDVADARNVAGGGLKPEQRVNAEMKMADDYRSATKNFTALSAGYNQIKTAYDMAKTDGTGASQISLLYGYMKMLDPNSVVREGEFATAENAPGVPSQILNTYNRIVNGQKIAPEALKSYMDNATSLYRAQGKVQKEIEGQFREAAKRYKLDPDNIIIGAPGASMLDTDVRPPTINGASDATPSTPQSQTLPTPDMNAIEAELRRRKAIK